MKQGILLIILWISVISGSRVMAQNHFIEGELVYSVIIRKNNPESQKENILGTFRILLKGSSVVKELSLETGFKNTIIYNGQRKKSYSLRTIGTEQYALELDEDHVQKKMAQCNQLKLEELPNDLKTIANFNTEKGKLLCNNAPPILIYYTKDWSINNPSLFENFPSFKHLPLSFDILNEDGSSIRFEFKNIQAKPMDNSAFEVPVGYKVISHEEYKSWQH